MAKTYTISEIKEWLAHCDSLGDAAHYCTEEELDKFAVFIEEDGKQLQKSVVIAWAIVSGWNEIREDWYKKGDIETNIHGLLLYYYGKMSK